jgi:hypothetical protein
MSLPKKPKVGGNTLQGPGACTFARLVGDLEAWPFSKIERNRNGNDERGATEAVQDQDEKRRLQAPIGMGASGVSWQVSVRTRVG